MEQMVCNVAGIKNHTCKTQIKNALDKVQGVQEVGITIASGELDISYNEPATKNKIRDCIENAGFKIL